MLHILLMILKIVGILIAVIFGLLVLVMLILVFTPLQYRFDGSCKGTLDSADVRLRFRWLYRLIDGYVIYREGKSDWQVRILWKKLHVEKELENAQQDALQKEKAQQEESEKTSDAEGEKETERPALEPRQTEEKKMNRDSNVAIKQEASQSASQEKKITWSEKIKKFFCKIKYTFQKFCDRIKIIAEKKERVLEFLADEIHQNAFKKIKEELIRLLHFLKPKYLSGCVHFGFEDPSLTGKTLAWLSMFYGMYGAHLTLEPDFQEKVLEGELHIRGKIRGIYFLIVAFHVWRSREVRTTYQHIRKFKI